MEKHYKEVMSCFDLLGIIKEKRMKRLAIGDLFEINTQRGKVYFQYVFEKKNIGSLIRILQGIYLKQPEDFNKIIEQKERFIINFPLKAAYKQEIVKRIGNYNIPNHFLVPKYMRSKRVDKDGNQISWEIVNYKTWNRETVYILTAGQKELSPWGIWNVTMLVEKINQGWTLEKW